MKVDMSPEAVTNRLKTMEQLWELSVNLMQAREIPKNLVSKSPEKDWNNLRANKSEQYLIEIPTIR